MIQAYTQPLTHMINNRNTHCYISHEKARERPVLPSAGSESEEKECVQISSGPKVI